MPQACIRHFSALTTAFESCGQDRGLLILCPLLHHPVSSLVATCCLPLLHLSLRLMVLTPAHQAQLHQVVADVGAEDLDKEKVEVTALQCHPCEAAEQAVVGEPPEDLAGPRQVSSGESAVEQEGQVEEEQAAHQVYMQPQVDAKGLLGPEPAPESPHGEQERQGHS